MIANDTVRPIKVAWITGYPTYQQNRLFTDPHCLVGAHAANGYWLEPYFHLHQAAASRGWQISTSDLLAPEKADIALFMDLPSSFDSVEGLKRKAPHVRTILMILESPLYRGFAFDAKNLSQFDAVLTYDPSLVNGKKIFPFRLPYETRGGRSTPAIGFKERKVASLIGTHQVGSVRQRIRHLRTIRKRGWRYSFPTWIEDTFFSEELYSARYDIAMEFGKRYPGALEVFGKGWEGTPGYQGVLGEAKSEALGRYRFNIAYENCVNERGYISEKLFDALEAGSVPVYKGEKRIHDYVPAGAFLDARKFRDASTLVEFLANISESEWLAYYEKGQAFLGSPQMAPFLSARFASDVLRAIEPALN